MKIIRTSDAESIDTAARVLNAGGVVVIPTDTVYGLAAHPAHSAAVERLYTIKGREAKKPIALLASDPSAIRAFGCEVPESLAIHWPGALTVVTAIKNEELRIKNEELRIKNDESRNENNSEFLILNSKLTERSRPDKPCEAIKNDESRNENNSEFLILNSKLTEGFRIPDHEWTRELLRRCGGVLRVTSANLSGRRAATDAPQALADVGLSADLVVDDGISPGGIPSTVVKVEFGGGITVLRQGAVIIQN